MSNDPEDWRTINPIYTPEHDKYLIWSNERRMWWRGGRYGYSKSHIDAGVYGREEAIQICKDANRYVVEGERINEVPVRLIDFQATLSP